MSRSVCVVRCVCTCVEVSMCWCVCTDGMEACLWMSVYAHMCGDLYVEVNVWKSVSGGLFGGQCICTCV